MLFDLQGSRKTAVKVIYLGLAILMAGGLVLFGIGSSVNGGLANVFSGDSGSSAAKDNVNKYAEQVQADPKNKVALQNLIAARYSLAGTPENFNQEKGTFSQEGKDQLELMKDDWNDYLKLTDDKPNLATANYAVSGFLGLEDAKGATKAQQIITEKQPNAANYLALMLYASYAGDSLVASGAEVQAKKLATKDEKKDVLAQIKEIKKQIGDRNAEVQKQIQEQFAQQAQGAAGGGAPANPFGGIGGAAAGAPAGQ
ncbi:MAG: hypothetical protein JHC98_03320 [Thermoleophilaceae bacterium]|nr:hypothetical protein [Thermoleophilaceae bacterium]